MFKENYKFIIAAIVLSSVPWIFATNQASVFFGTVALLMFLFKNDGIATMVIPLCALFFPVQVGTGGIDETADATYKVSQIILYALPLSVIAIYLYKFFKNRLERNLPKTIVIALAFFIVVSFINSMSYGNYLDIAKTSVFIVCFYAYYQIVNYNCNIDKYFKLIDVCFIVLSVYAILEFYLGIFPYTGFVPKITDIYSMLDSRIHSLSCCPLIFVGFLTFYLDILFVRFFQHNHKPLPQFILLLVVSILAMSRTIFIVELCSITFFYIGYIIYGKTTGKIIIPIIFTTVISIVLFYFNDAIELAFNRFELTEVSLTARQDAFGVAQSHFIEYPFGEGTYYTKKMFALGQGRGPEALDNLFLDMICRFGIFALLWIACIAYPFKIKWIEIQNNKELRFLYILFILTLFLLSFSFIFLNYNCLVMLVICTIALFKPSMQ